MKSVPISQVVQVNPRVIGAGGTQGSLDGLLVTQSAAVAADALQVFYTPQAVADFFGSTSDEATAARVYFAGIVNGGQQPASLTFGRFAADATGAGIFGASLNLSLGQLQALSGTLQVTVGATIRLSQTINLSAATSFANAATLMTAGFTSPDFVITYDAARRRFLLTVVATGVDSEVSVVTGTLADGVGLSAASGAYRQAVGTEADDPASAMGRISAASSNWSTFSHVWGASITERLGFAEWTAAQTFQFIFVGWDNAAADLVPDNADTFGHQVINTPYNNTLPMFGDIQHGAAALAWAASTNMQVINGRNTLAFRTPVAAITSQIDNLAHANALLSNGYTYLGTYASTANTYVVFYNGKVGGPFGWSDTTLGQIWLRRNLQQALFETLLAYNSLPYNADGYNAIYQGAQDAINQAVQNGTIRPGVTLSPSQRAQIDAQAGFPIAGEVVDKGWYLQVTDPLTTTVRTERGSPTVNFWYADGGSIQKIVVSSATVL